ncbi:hypothetical protein, partial [Klebsiella aerogenes]|uniref:hypothetical protein n=1 Tax=Klebsiella aerogenes TaxID=548 RepID=UPI0019544E5F
IDFSLVPSTPADKHPKIMHSPHVEAVFTCKAFQASLRIEENVLAAERDQVRPFRPLLLVEDGREYDEIGSAVENLEQ